MPTLSLVKFSKFEPVLLTVPYLSLIILGLSSFSQILIWTPTPITLPLLMLCVRGKDVGMANASLQSTETRGELSTTLYCNPRKLCQNGP